MVQKRVLVKIKRIHPEAKVPTRGSEHSAGFDLYSVEDIELNPGERKLVSTGISIDFPEGLAVLFWDRSGMGVKGIHRFAGVIDSDYRGEWKVVLFNSTKDLFKINKGDRIAQAILQDYYVPEFVEVENLEETSRGAGGFGSTGVK